MKPREFSALMALSLAISACGSNTSGGPASSGASSGGSSGGASGSSSGASSGAAASGGSTGSTSGGASGSTSGGSSGSASGGGASGSGGGSAEGGTVDASVPDAGAPAEAGTGTVTCGATPAALNVALIGKMEQMSVAPDGTIYWSNQGTSVGRYAPPYAATALDTAWKTIAGAKINGIALDPKRGVLYAGSREAPDKLYKIQLATPATTSSVVLPSSQSINGVTIADDGTVYYTDQTGGNVYRIGPTETAPTKVNTMPVAQANDLAFGPDGLLYVNTWSPTPATILRVNIQTGAVEIFATLTGSGNGDGIAFDSAGNLYAAAGHLYKVTPAKAVTMLSNTAAAGIEFGCGAISCNDMFYSAPAAATMKMTVTPGGMDVFWHRP